METEWLSEAEKNFLIMVTEKTLALQEYTGGHVLYTCALLMRANKYYTSLGDANGPTIIEHLKKMKIPRCIKTLRMAFRENDEEDELVVLPFLVQVTFRVMTKVYDEEEERETEKHEIFIQCYGIYNHFSTFYLSILNKEQVDIVLAFLQERHQIKTLVDLYHLIGANGGDEELTCQILDTSLGDSENDDIEPEYQDYEETDEQKFDRMYENALEQAHRAFEKSQQETLYD